MGWICSLAVEMGLAAAVPADRGAIRAARVTPGLPAPDERRRGEPEVAAR